MTWEILGDPSIANTLVIADHASAALPDGIDLGLPSELMREHIAFDIGVRKIATALAAQPGTAAICAQWSRLLVDLNRSPDDPAVIPESSDGVIIPGNSLAAAERRQRLERYHLTYHSELDRLLDQVKPRFLLFLHSFTPRLGSGGPGRPWDVGLLYNDDKRASEIAMHFFEDHGFTVGDQQPYSGLIYNYTFVRHAEKRGLPYILLEIKQDLIDNADGQERFVTIIRSLCREMVERLA